MEREMCCAYVGAEAPTPGTALAWIATQSAHLELAAGLQGTYYCASLLPRCADHGNQFFIVG